MIRTEVYANRSVEEDIVEAIEGRVPGTPYSLIEDVKGRGNAGVRHGSAIWPELNILYIFYSEEEEARLIRESINFVKKAFPQEGIKVFQFKVECFGEV